MSEKIVKGVDRGVWYLTTAKHNKTWIVCRIYRTWCINSDSFVKVWKLRPALHRIFASRHLWFENSNIARALAVIQQIATAKWILRVLVPVRDYCNIYFTCSLTIKTMWIHRHHKPKGLPMPRTPSSSNIGYNRNYMLRNKFHVTFWSWLSPSIVVVVGALGPNNWQVICQSVCVSSPNNASVIYAWIHGGKICNL